MLEFVLCSLVTIWPDYLVRRFVQGKRWGRELTLFSIWYELRWGLTVCAVLTVGVLTMIFYYHPATSNVVSIYRTITILPETGGRVAEVLVRNNDRVEAGALLFRLDASLQRAAVETDSREVDELDAAGVVAQSELAAAEGVVLQAESALRQARDELARSTELSRRNANVVSARDLERQRSLVDSRDGALTAAIASRGAVEAKIATLIPAQKASAVAALAEAEVALAKTEIFAGVAGTVEQFGLQPGDYVSPVLRPAGILVPRDRGGGRFVAGFDQLAATVLKPGMIAEITCLTKAFTIIPMVVTEVQDVIATGQLRPTDQLLDLATVVAGPGTVTVFLDPLFPSDADGIPPGSRCIANAYTSNHDLLAAGNLSPGAFLFYHAVDATAVVHAGILRIQALLLLIRALVFAGH